MAERIATDTVRQQVLSCLNKGPMNAIEISQDIGIMEKEVYEHLGTRITRLSFENRENAPVESNQSYKPNRFLMA